MNGAWMTVWEIAGKRHGTKMGEGHLSERAHSVLEDFVMLEAQQTMSQALGGLWATVRK